MPAESDPFAPPGLSPASFEMDDHALIARSRDAAPVEDGRRVLIGGDWAAVRGFTDAPTRSPEHLYGGLLPTIRAADLAVVNLECPLGGEEPLIKDGPAFRVDPAAAPALAEAGFHVATLANNHIYDQQAGGLTATLDACREAGLRTVGAGASLPAACAPIFHDVGGLRVGILALAESEGGLADLRGHGGAAPIEDLHVLDRCRAARQACDVLLLIAHGGVEYTPFPPTYWYDRLRALAGAGVDAVVAHHPHVPQGMVWAEREEASPVPILFSTGNFVFPPREPTNIAAAYMDLGYMVELSLTAEGVAGVRLHPYRIDAATGLAPLSERCMADFKTFMAALSEPLADPAAVEARFDVAAAYLWRENWHQRVAGLTAKMCADDLEAMRHGRNHFRSAAHAMLIDRVLTRKLEGTFGQADPELTEQLTQWFPGHWPIRWRD